ncbi:SnoaL-like domain-containing protein [Salinimicrobium catena]|uniref:SnoaL-like domain-containing protein n=1 Tax=Salinimicrobium catena TaxID=390640 RepID=A0A1H5M8J2_9FLAO|nr:nuclear transport factor 2 family protein [Salinimicrobium catena]SDL19446.1 SnoaL-like domain-containing protein [Salinimicrobium catena]SEE85107.1 SnoaL-like domain-containing protein [Salinimicrobium catena]
MSLEAKECVEKFYTSDFYKNPETIKDYLHPDAQLFWNSSAGFHKLKYQEICDMSKELTRSFESLRADISHLLDDNDTITIRFTYHVRTIENPDEELPMAHFIAIWEMRDGKMFKGHQISQQADDSPENLDSFLPIN